MPLMMYRYYQTEEEELTPNQVVVEFFGLIKHIEE